MIIYSFIGLFVGSYCGIIIWRNRPRNPVAVLPCEDGDYSIFLNSHESYCISILGARSISTPCNPSITIIGPSSNKLIPGQGYIETGFMIDGNAGVDCWCFKAREQGDHRIEFHGMNLIEAKGSALIVNKIFMSPIQNNKLRILIYKSISPVFKVLANIFLIVGLIAAVFGAMSLFAER